MGSQIVGILGVKKIWLVGLERFPVVTERTVALLI